MLEVSLRRKLLPDAKLSSVFDVQWSRWTVDVRSVVGWPLRLDGHVTLRMNIMWLSVHGYHWTFFSSYSMSVDKFLNSVCPQDKMLLHSSMLLLAMCAPGKQELPQDNMRLQGETLLYKQQLESSPWKKLSAIGAGCVIFTSIARGIQGIQAHFPTCK